MYLSKVAIAWQTSCDNAPKHGLCDRTQCTIIDISGCVAILWSGVAVAALLHGYLHTPIIWGWGHLTRRLEGEGIHHQHSFCSNRRVLVSNSGGLVTRRSLISPRHYMNTKPLCLAYPDVSQIPVQDNLCYKRPRHPPPGPARAPAPIHRKWDWKGERGRRTREKKERKKKKVRKKKEVTASRCSS